MDVEAKAALEMFFVFRKKSSVAMEESAIIKSKTAMFVWCI